jgi:hypothetical protein
MMITKTNVNRTCAPQDKRYQLYWFLMMVCHIWNHLLCILGTGSFPVLRLKLRLKPIQLGVMGKNWYFLNVHLVYFLVFEYAVY